MCKLVLLSITMMAASSVANTCVGDTFQCSSVEIIECVRVCDRHMDCSNGSDEFNCDECKFSPTDRCGWITQNMVFHNESNLYGLIGINKLGIFKQEKLTMYSPALPTMSKSCVLQADIYVSDIFYSDSTLEIFRVDSPRNDLIGRYNLSIYDTMLDCRYHRMCFKPRMNYTLGYLPQNSHINIEVKLETSYGFSEPGFGVQSFRFVDCDPSKVQFDCYFEDESKCSGWSHDSLRNKGTWKFQNSYLYVDYLNGHNLAEFRSPLITPRNNSCIEFQYLIVDFEDKIDANILNVTMVNLGGNGPERTLWSSSESTHGKWVQVLLDINTEIDIDIGFIAGALNGIIAIDTILLKNHPCQSIIH